MTPLFSHIVPATFPALALAHCLALLSPGPDFFLILGHAARHRLRGTLSDGRVLTVAGTLAGTRRVPKIVGINGYEVEVPIEQHHIVMRYADRPGIVAIYGQELGEAGINIAGLFVARPDASGRALSVLTVDQPVPDEILENMRAAVAADLFRQIEITAE